MKRRDSRAAVSSILIALALVCTACGNPQRKEVEEIVRRRAAELIQTNAAAIHPNRPLVRQGADELDVVQLIMAIEEEFRVEIPDRALGTNAEDISNSLTVEKLSRIILEQRAARDTSAATPP